MTGRVDGQFRALVRVSLAASPGGPVAEFEAWVDTAFNGGLTLPRSAATELGLSPGVSGDAVLADGSRVELESFVCISTGSGGPTERRPWRPTAPTRCSARSCWPVGGW